MAERDGTPGAGDADIEALESVLANHALTPVFQPVVDLITGATVGFEALTRGPARSPVQMPAKLFDAARRADRLGELDWMARLTALGAALEIGLRPPMTLFLNVEPEVLDDEPPTDDDHVLARAMGGLRVIVELTERALLSKPRKLLAFVEELRRRGWGVAVDDIGVHPYSVAMLSVIEPDVVKLDRTVLQQMTASDATTLVSGVHAYCRRSGARILCEGLERSEDVARARAAGARLGQGWAFGAPQRIRAPHVVETRPIPMISPRPHLPTRRLITLATRRLPPTREDWHEVERLTRYLIEYVSHLGATAIVVAGVQHRDRLTPIVAAAFEQLATKVPYVALLGVGMDDDVIAGVHGIHISPADPLTSEWILAIIGLEDNIALIGADLGDDEGASRRRYEVIVSYDPLIVTDIARALLARI
ncbi:MAG: EAL domain-containing protein [Frankiaceae bacterium]